MLKNFSLLSKSVRLLNVSKSRMQFFGKKINVKFIDRRGEIVEVKARPGDSILDTVIDNEIETEGYGICGGGIACSTCHVILEDGVFDKTLEEDPWGEEECDMLDNAPNVTDL